MTHSVREQYFRKHLTPTQASEIKDHYIESQPPYRFIDRVLIRDDEQTQVLKNITRNEWSLVYTDRDGYQFPRTMLLECMAQTAGTYDEYLQKTDPPSRILLTRIKSVEFHGGLTPGDQVIITARLLKVLSINVMYDVKAHVAGELVASCTIFLARV